MGKYRSIRDFGDVKMKGKKSMKNFCPCCDPITNDKEQILREEIDRLVRLELTGQYNTPKRIESLTNRLKEIQNENN
jgi:hypothetical protein